MGSEKHPLFQKIVLEELFPELPNIQRIQKLWNRFQQLYTVLQQEEISSDEVDTFREDDNNGY